MRFSGFVRFFETMISPPHVGQSGYCLQRSNLAYAKKYAPFSKSWQLFPNSISKIIALIRFKVYRPLSPNSNRIYLIVIRFTNCWKPVLAYIWANIGLLITIWRFPSGFHSAFVVAEIRTIVVYSLQWRSSNKAQLQRHSRREQSNAPTHIRFSNYWRPHSQDPTWPESS